MNREDRLKEIKELSEKVLASIAKHMAKSLTGTGYLKIKGK